MIKLFLSIWKRSPYAGWENTLMVPRDTADTEGLVKLIAFFPFVIFLLCCL